MDFFYGLGGLQLKYIRLKIFPSFAECAEDESANKCVKSRGATVTVADLANAQAAVGRTGSTFVGESVGVAKSNH